jgi:hypothetical protein
MIGDGNSSNVRPDDVGLELCHGNMRFRKPTGAKEKLLRSLLEFTVAKSVMTEQEPQRLKQEKN